MRSKLWTLKSWKAFLRNKQCHKAIVDQCMYGLKLPTGEFLREPTMFWSNRACLLKFLDKRCDNSHAHFRIAGKFIIIPTGYDLAQDYLHGPGRAAPARARAANQSQSSQPDPEQPTRAREPSKKPRAGAASQKARASLRPVPARARASACAGAGRVLYRHGPRARAPGLTHRQTGMLACVPACVGAGRALY